MMLREWIRVFFEAVEEKGVHHYSAVAAARHIARELMDRGLKLPYWGEIIGIGEGGGRMVCKTKDTFLGVDDFKALLNFNDTLDAIEAIMLIH